MAVMMALATIATCLQKRFEVCPFGDSYTEPVNVMTITGAEPATRKSVVVKALTEPLSVWEMTQADQLKDVVKQVRHERDLIIKTIDSIKSAASKPSTTETDRREALAEIKRLDDSMPPEVTPPRLREPPTAAHFCLPIINKPIPGEIIPSNSNSATFSGFIEKIKTGPNFVGGDKIRSTIDANETM